MAESGELLRECGFCLRKDSSLEEPKVLPCSHAHCLRCLTAYFNLEHLVRCPTCREVYDVTLDSLPAASPVEDNSPCCDICTDDGVKDQHAVTYCVSCSKKYCAQHKLHHDALYKVHSKIPISEYRSRYRKLEVRSCTEHGLPLTMGCRTCLTVICVQCVNDTRSCTDGVGHELYALDELVARLTKEVNTLKAEVIDREDKLEELFKKTSGSVADHEAETEEMLERIHQRRDEQIEAIIEKYEALEKELIEQRAKCKSAMSKFMEEDVGMKLADLGQNRMKVESRIKHSHQVDIVTGYKDTVSNIQKLLDGKVPELELKKMLCKLNTKEMCRDIELEMIYTNGVIDWEKGLTTTKAFPKSLTLQQTVQMDSFPSSVCHYQALTYVGRSNKTVSRIDGSYQLMDRFIGCDSCIACVNVYKDRVYTLLRVNPSRVNVHDLSGQLTTSWSHPETTYGASKLTIIYDQVVIPNRELKRLDIYSLTGQVIKHIPCPQLSAGIVAICAVDDDSVVVSDYQSNQVFRIRISTGEVIWTTNDVNTPEGIVCYGQRYVMVASYSSHKIRILDVRTGAFLSDITADSLSGHVFDLHISGGTLIIPLWNKGQVLYYQMNS